MLTKNMFGIIILLFNLIGLGYLLFLGALAVLKKNAFKEKIEQDPISSEKKERTSLVVQDNIIPDEDDLLKDMDLSDLDNLDLDDFK